LGLTTVVWTFTTSLLLGVSRVFSTDLASVLYLTRIPVRLVVGAGGDRAAR